MARTSTPPLDTLGLIGSALESGSKRKIVCFRVEPYISRITRPFTTWPSDMAVFKAPLQGERRFFVALN